jgi:hypothetical protein
MYALHFENGVPWTEALSDAPWPARVQAEWDGDARAIPAGMPVYVGIAPLATDRKSLALSRGERDNQPLPLEFQGLRLDDPKVERAYLNYARRAVRAFHPRYLNLGIEAGEMLSRDLAHWPEFAALYHSVRVALKREFPDVPVGISFGLGDLRAPQEAIAARSLIADSDYLGLSFYPYAAGFDAKFGAPPYASASGAAQWREPLAWIRAYADKPIAICETGYTTRDIDLRQYDLHLPGSVPLQTAYVRDLFAIAQRDRYAFVVYFLAIDYDRLYAKLPAGSELDLLWRNIGLIDGDVHPKPAWQIWKDGVARSKVNNVSP